MMENLAARKIRKEKEAAFAPLPMIFSLGETCLLNSFHFNQVGITDQSVGQTAGNNDAVSRL